ncbi:beta-fructofuranosidase, insoluble isoenzyme CWINV6 [Capsicum annuum]|nr:beta-fructofuranosidase, insoluble isoenzyme CWINV6 [Capsicum annuum]
MRQGSVDGSRTWAKNRISLGVGVGFDNRASTRSGARMEFGGQVSSHEFGPKSRLELKSAFDQMAPPSPEIPNLQGTQHKRVTVHNSHGEELVGVLHETNSLELVIICHGFKSSKSGRVEVEEDSLYFGELVWIYARALDDGGNSPGSETGGTVQGKKEGSAHGVYRLGEGIRQSP